MDNELFELCKEVYKRHEGWDTTDFCYAYLENPYVKGLWAWEVIPLHEDNVDDVDEWHPLYTSDYLLEKLPKRIKDTYGKAYWLTLSPIDGDGSWSACYEYENNDSNRIEWSDSPLKALLKLTIALHEAGELK